MQLGLQIIEIKRGESAKSLRTWATIFGCTPKTVSSFFKMLESDKMLVITTIGKGKQSTTLINITKYEDYQGSEETQDTTLSKRKLPTIEERKNEKKNSNSKFIPPVLEDVIIYFDENGYSKEAATKAFNYYNNLGWKNSKGNQVVNWKNTMLNNWFKDENKKKVQSPIIPTFYY